MHGHFLIFGGGVTPECLQRASAYPALMELVIAKMESIFTASLPDSMHVASVALKFKKSDIPAPMFFQCPNPVTEAGTFRKFVNTTINYANMHTVHHETCLQKQDNPAELCVCRLAYGRELFEQTCVQQLQAVDRDDADRPRKRTKLSPTASRNDSRTDGSGSQSGFRVLPQIAEPDRTFREDRNRSVCPIPLRDDRVLFFAMRRPVVPVAAVTDPALPDVVQDAVITMSDAQLEKLKRDVVRRNREVVETIPVVTGLVKGNVAAYPLGSVEQAVSAAGYESKYMSKNPLKLTTTAALVHDASVHVGKYKPMEFDPGNPERGFRQVLNRASNSQWRFVEVSSQQASSANMGYPADYSTDMFEVFNVKSAIDHVITTNQVVYPVSRAPTSTTVMSGVLPTSSSIPTQSHTDSAPIYVGEDGLPIHVPQHISYMYRGAEAAALSFYEYVGVIMMVKIAAGKSGRSSNDTDESESDSETDSESDSSHGTSSRGRSKRRSGNRKCSPRRPKRLSQSKRGRNSNLRFPFDSRHPLHSRFEQQVRSKQRIPRIVGDRFVPSHPGPRPAESDKAWETAALQYAEFMLTVFRPWSTDTLTPGRLSIEELVRFVNELEAEDTFVSQCRLAAMYSMTHSTSAKSAHRRILRAKRFLEADKISARSLRKQRNIDEIPVPPVDPTELEQRSTLNEKAGELLERLRQRQECDENSPAAVRKRKSDARWEQTKSFLEAVFDVRSVSSDIELRPGSVVLPFTFAPRTDVSMVLSELQQAPKVTTLREFARIQATSAPKSTVFVNRPNHSSTSSRVPAVASLEQQRALDTAVGWLREELTHFNSPNTVQRPEQLLLMIHGPPGCGKTFFAEQLQREAMSLNDGVVMSAFCSSAACLLPGGRTNASLYSIPVFAKGETNVFLNRLTIGSLQDLQRWIEDCHLILIDEISMTSPVMLAQISARLCEARNSKRPFGGMGVIVMGDGFQIPPTNGFAFYKPVVDDTMSNHELKFGGGRPKRTKRKSAGSVAHLPALKRPYKKDSAGAHGVWLLKQFKKIEFTSQFRSEDRNHTAVIQAIRKPSLRPPISPDVFDYLHRHILTAQDVIENPDWRFAPILVTGNRQRTNLNMEQAKRFALATNQPVVCFRYRIQKSSLELSHEEKEYLYNNYSESFGVFVRGARSYLTEPVAPRRHLPNGRRCTQHSLTFDPCESDTAVAECKRIIEQGRPGEVVFIPLVPLSINVEIEDLPVELFDKNLSMSPSTTVVPITFRSNPAQPLQITYDEFLPTCSITFAQHSVELGFSVTYHKMQGRSEPLIILDLNESAPRVELTHLYVGLSRVKLGDNFRILPPVDSSSLDYLTKLRHDLHLCVWLSSYTDDGVWSDDQCVQTIHQLGDPSVAAMFAAVGTPSPMSELTSQLLSDMPGPKPATRQRQTHLSTVPAAGQSSASPSALPRPATRPIVPGSRPHYSGLQNRGNTCFINSAIQV